MPLSYTYRMEVPPTAIDLNGHVNNVAFVQWMQDAAVAHADSVGCTDMTQRLGATWVVRRHEIEYRRQAFLGDRIEIRTWIVDCRRVSSRRKYEFVRPSDGMVLARGQTDWVLIDLATFGPKEIPPEIQRLYDGGEADAGAPGA